MWSSSEDYRQDTGAARNSIGLVLVGGMFVGTLFTIFVVPSIYMLVAKDHSRDRVQENFLESVEESV